MATTTPVAAAPVAAPAAAPAAPAAAAPATAAPAQPYTSASLYVGDLRTDVTEGQLFDHFKNCGTIASIRVCRDAITRRSLGYAYVNFHNNQDADRALDLLNYSEINGKPCRIMWSHRDPSKRKSGAGNIYIKNLAKTVKNSQLLDTFGTFGNILSCKVETDDEGHSKGYGYVHFEKEEDAQNAIAQLNGKVIEGQVVYVGPFIPQRERSSNGKEAKYTNVYVKNLSPEFTDVQLKEAFATFGEITSCFISPDQNGKSRGFGFVNFATHEAAEAAVTGMNGKTINDKQIYVARAQKKSERERELKATFERYKAENAAKNLGSNLYVRNITDSVTDDELRTLFAPFGTITSAKVMHDERGVSKGFGFVCFSTPEESLKAISEMNGSLVHQKPLYVAQAQKKAIRIEQLRQLHQRAPFGAPFLQTGQPLWYPGRPAGPGFISAPPYPGQMIRGPWPTQGNMRRFGMAVPQQALLAGTGPAGMPAGQAPVQSSGFPRVQRGAVQGQGQRRATSGMPSGQRGPLRKTNAGYVAQQPAVGGIPAAPAADATAPATSNFNFPLPEPTIPAPGPQQALTAEEFAALTPSPADLKYSLGERLFNHISTYFENVNKVGKLTGMLLESMPSISMNNMLADPVMLKAKVAEANNVFEAHQASLAK